MCSSEQSNKNERNYCLELVDFIEVNTKKLAISRFLDSSSRMSRITGECNSQKGARSRKTLCYLNYSQERDAFSGLEIKEHGVISWYLSNNG